MSPPPIFICYRRTDAGWAGRLERELIDRFGRASVFRDHAIPGGVDWRAHIEAILDECRVMVVMIGPSWMQADDGDGCRRLWREDDVVRREIERGLARPDVHVVPVLFDRAVMPTPDELPSGLQGLCELQALELSDSHWAFDAKVIGDLLRRWVRTRWGTHKPGTAPARVPARSLRTMVVVSALGWMLAWPVTYRLADYRPFPLSRETMFSGEWIEVTLSRVALFCAERAMLWGLVVGAVLAAAYLAQRETRAGSPAAFLLGLRGGAVAGALGGLALIVLEDVGGVHSPALLNAVTMAVTGAVLAGRFATLRANTTARMLRTAGLAAGFVGGVVGLLAFSAFDPALAAAAQAVVVIGTLFVVMALPSRPRDAATAGVMPTP